MLEVFLVTSAKTVAIKIVGMFFILVFFASLSAYTSYRLFVDKVTEDALRELNARITILDQNVAFANGLVSKTIPFDIDLKGSIALSIPLGEEPITGGEFLTSVVLYDPSGFSQTNKWIIQVSPKADSVIAGGDGIALQIPTITPSGSELMTPSRPYVLIGKDATVVTGANGAKPQLAIQLTNNHDKAIKGAVICTGHSSIAKW